MKRYMIRYSGVVVIEAQDEGMAMNLFNYIKQVRTLGNIHTAVIEELPAKEKVQ